MKFIFLLAPLWLLWRRGQRQETLVTVILTVLCVLFGVLACLFDFTKLWQGVFS